MSVITPIDSSTDTPARRHRRLGAMIVGALLAIGIAVASWTFVFDARSSLAAPWQPGAEDGVLTSAVSLDVVDTPALAKLDPALLDAMRQAAEAAAADGIRFEVTSGWRSKHYQEWLLDDAVRTYGDEQTARQYVSTPDASRHVTGEAIDIGPVDAQFWLMEHGATWGLCQIYANERWHFELATDPGGQCPIPLTDAAG
jgi:zinc D-Ala-D-Ala carboxypeptidase